jgi:hypothetical protein
VGFSKENSEENPIHSTKRKKPAPRVAAEDEQRIGVLDAKVNQIAPFNTGVMQAGIDNLKAKLGAITIISCCNIKKKKGHFKSIWPLRMRIPVTEAIWNLKTLHYKKRTVLLPKRIILC